MMWILKTVYITLALLYLNKSRPLYTFYVPHNTNIKKFLNLIQLKNGEKHFQHNSLSANLKRILTEYFTFINYNWDTTLSFCFVFAKEQENILIFLCIHYLCVALRKRDSGGQPHYSHQLLCKNELLHFLFPRE